MKKCVSVVLCLMLTLSISTHAMAAASDEFGLAVDSLREQGIMVGDQNGNLNLESHLTRIEMATILTRLHGGSETVPGHYDWACYYTDVPDWARGYVGYCTANLLMVGYGTQRFGSNDPVTPQMACTVILRAFEYADGEGTAWNYDSACSYAIGLGLIEPETAGAELMTRGEMAVLIYRAQSGQPEVPGVPVFQAEGIRLAQDGSVISKTITQPDWSRADFSQEANPEIFSGVYSRGWYNAIRQSLVDRDAILDGNNSANFNPQYLYAHTVVTDDRAEATAFAYILGRLGGYTYFTLGAEPYVENQYDYPGYAIVKVSTETGYQEALSFIEPELERIAGMDTRSQVIALNHYLCDLMEYDASGSASAHEIFSAHGTPVPGRCSSYAAAFAFLCGASDIPCVLVSSDTHTWNEVYVDGQWQVVDVSANDAAGGPNQDNYLLKERSPGTDRCPQGTQFAKELLVPGSTK